MHIVNLASGSKGNSTFIECGNTKLLIDCGLAEKTLSERLAEIGQNLADIDAILITHEHIDHIRGLKKIAKKYKAKFYINQKLKETEEFQIPELKKDNLFAFNEQEFKIGGVTVLPLELSHDAKSTNGFILSCDGGEKVAFVTDTGVIPQKTEEQLCGVKMIFLESNYDEEMLLNGKYPYVIKQRILSEKGHLSNKQSLELAKKLYATGTKCFVLSHISENNNTHELAFKNYTNYFESIGLKLEKDVFVRVSFQNKVGNNFNIREDLWKKNQ